MAYSFDPKDDVEEQRSFIFSKIRFIGTAKLNQNLIRPLSSIFDTMNYVRCNVATLCLGQACSMGSCLAQAGAPGKRIILPNARHMIHQPSGGARGMQSDIEISYKEITYLKKRLTEIYVKHNSAGKTYEEFERDMDRDKFMSADEALAYGLIDQIVEKRQ